MEKTFIGVRDVDKEIFRKFRATTIDEKMKLGVAVGLAMQLWLNEKRSAGNKKKLSEVECLLKVKPFNWGRGTEKTSVEVDEVLYGNIK